LLKNNQGQTESEIGGNVEWQASGNGSRIAVYRTDFNPNDLSQRPEQYEWFLQKTQRFEQVFRGRIRALELDDVPDTVRPDFP
jgi:hypothetical protein